MDNLLNLLTSPMLGTPTWLWLSFFAIVIALLVFDLGVLHRDQHEIEMRRCCGILCMCYVRCDILCALISVIRVCRLWRKMCLPFCVRD